MTRTRLLSALAGVMLAPGTLAAPPPLAKSFRQPAASPPAAKPSSAGLAQPMPDPAKPGATPPPVRTVTPDPTGQSSSTVSSSYKVSAGDQLEIYVWGDDRLQRSLSVLPDGTFSFPLAGTIVAAGKTPNQIEAELSGLLAGQYKGVAPQVTVSVRQPSGMQVSVIGKVRAPTTIAPTRYITVLDALALTGGPSDFADVKNIVVLRRIGGKTTVLRTHLGSALKGKPNATDLGESGNPVLMAGDTVVVP